MVKKILGWICAAFALLGGIVTLTSPTDRVENLVPTVFFAIIAAILFISRKKKPAKQPRTAAKPAPAEKQGETVTALAPDLQNPLRAAFTAVKLNPDLIRIDQHGDSGFTIRYDTIYLGRYYRSVTPDKWAVKKPGATRATRVFENEIEARDMIAARPEYQIEYRHGQNYHSLQYMTSLQDYEEIESPTADQSLFVMEQWARYARVVTDEWAQLARS